MQFIPVQTSIFKKGEDIFAFFCASLKQNRITLAENSVCILSSKLVALSQGRKVSLNDKKNFEQLIQQESKTIFSQTKNFFLTLSQGIVIPNAGIDRSNTQENTAILWPNNPEDFAENFKAILQEKFGIKNIGIVISDSRITPRRRGTVGVALAWTGIQGVYDMRGKQDIFGNTLKVSTVNIADNIVSGAEILMGQGDEKTPFVICQDFPSQYFTTKKQSPSDAFIDQDEDLFRL